MFELVVPSGRREEAEAEESKKKSDEMRLTLAIQKSKEEAEKSQVFKLRVPFITDGTSLKLKNSRLLPFYISFGISVREVRYTTF